MVQFTDPAGRTWGEIGYFYGIRNCWVCIDDPYNGALPPDENCVTVALRAQATPEPAEMPAPAETPAPAGKTVELTPPADDAAVPRGGRGRRRDRRGGGAGRGAAEKETISASVPVSARGMGYLPIPRACFSARITLVFYR